MQTLKSLLLSPRRSGNVQKIAFTQTVNHPIWTGLPNSFTTVNAMGYIQLHGLPENVFNLYSWGGYLEWYRPETKVFIDSRTDIFEYAGVFKDYFGIARIEDTYALLDKYQIRSVFLPPDYPICYMLEHRPEWKIMYKDSIAVLLVREGPAPSPPKGRKVQDQDAR